MKIIATNKKAHFEYFILKKFEAGISLQGSEVKSIRAGNVSLKESFVVLKNGEAYINNMFIKNYDKTGNFKPDERRLRKLLLHKSEIQLLISKVAEKGLTVVPLSIYLDKQLVKLEIALCKGKLLHDKRKSIKDRDIERDIRRELKIKNGWHLLFKGGVLVSTSKHFAYWRVAGSSALLTKQKINAEKDSVTTSGQTTTYSFPRMAACYA